MRRISYTEHLELRLKIRKIPYELPKEVYEKTSEKYFDNETEKFIAVSSAKYKGKIREFAVAYEEDEQEVRLITIHPLKPYQKFSRLRSRRWQKL